MSGGPTYTEWGNYFGGQKIDINSDDFPSGLRQFFSVSDDGYVFVVGISEVSRHYDMADCFEDNPDYWTFIGGKFRKVETGGNYHRINTDEEFPFRFAASDLVAGGVVVGQVIHTDH